TLTVLVASCAASGPTRRSEVTIVKMRWLMVPPVGPACRAGPCRRRSLNRLPRPRGRGSGFESGSANAEGADIGPAALGVAPRLVEALATEGVLDGQGRFRLHALGQRRVVGGFVAARLVVLGVQAACLDLGVAGLHLRAGVALALADLEIHRG